MPITDYKVTDIERDAVRMQGKADPLQGTLAQNQAEFDEYPELVRDNLDGLCDFIATMPIAYLSSAAAATANKGAISGFVPLGAILEISMTNGNTSANPTISIDGVTHTFTNMPTTAQVQANSTQTYRFVKTGATVLTFTKNPDYISEYGTNSDGFPYTRYASGRYDYGVVYNPVITAASGTITSYTSSGYYIKVGREISMHFTFKITNVGTGTGQTKISIPFVCRSYSTGSGIETSGTGMIAVILSVNDTVAGAVNYATSNITTTNTNGVCSISYITD